MCPRCQQFCERIAITRPDEYYALARRLEGAVREGTLLFISGHKLEDIQEDQPWPDDMTEHVLRCATCGQQFVLAVETYHGSGGTWRAVGVRR